MSTMPKQKRGRSSQDYVTPWPFIRAVEARFGQLVCDLACTRSNARACAGYYFDDGINALTERWAEDYPNGHLWLNPPYAAIAPWAAKVALEASNRRGLISLLTPASIGSDWFAWHVMPSALVIGLSPRIAFEGTPVNPKTGKVDGYPKDLMLSVFGMGRTGLEVWRWDKRVSRMPVRPLANVARSALL